MKIVIMRHGKPFMDLESRTYQCSPYELKNILEQYESSDLDLTQLPPQASSDIAQQCTAVFSSDLPRGVSSIKLLNTGNEHSINSCFQEVSLPYVHWKKPVLSFSCWAIIFRIAWLFGFSNKAESIKDARKRARMCANQLASSAYKNNTVLLLGHGIINHLIAKELQKQKWRQTENTGNRYWSFRVYEKHH